MTNCKQTSKITFNSLFTFLVPFCPSLNDSTWAEPVDSSSNCVNIVEKYDILENTWYMCAPMKNSRRLHGSCYFAGFIYVFGGCVDSPVWFTSEAEVYDVRSDSWSSIKPVPVTGSMSAINIGAFIYLFVHGSAIFRFDPIFQTYESLGDYPIEDWNCFSVAAIETTIVLCGGMSMGKLCNETYCFETLSIGQPSPSGGVIDCRALWRREVSMPQARRRSAAVVVRSFT